MVIAVDRKKYYKKPSKIFGGFIFLYYICSVNNKSFNNLINLKNER